MEISNVLQKADLKYRLFKFRKRKKSYLEEEKKGNGGEETFSHVTYYAVGNAGDTVLSKCVRKTVLQSMSVKEWDVISLDEPVDEKIIGRINSTSKLFIGGGGLFLPDTNSNSISGWQWAISKEHLEKIRVPICVYSVGYNYFRGQETTALFQESLVALLEKSSFFGLRNTGSIREIKRLVPEELWKKIVYQPCTTTLIRKLFGDQIPEKSKTGKIAVNMAFDRVARRFGNNKEKILSQVAQAIKEIERKGYQIFYVSHCGVDKEFVPYLRKYGIKFKALDFSLSYPDTIFKFYNDIDVAIGMRGHAQMIPFGLNCEIISMGTHEKMKWFLEDIDALDWYVELTEDVDNVAKRIVDRFEYVHERDNETTRKRLLEQQQRLWNITINNLKTINSL